MNIAQLRHKLWVIANVEIVVPFLPEMLRVANQTPRYSLLQRLQRIVKPETVPHPLQGWLEGSPACVRGKQPTAMVAAEGDEMTLPAVVKTR